MNKILLLFLIASFFAPIFSDTTIHTCAEADLLYIMNHCTGYYLGTDGGYILGLDNKLLDEKSAEALEDNIQDESIPSDIGTLKTALDYDHAQWCFNDMDRTFYEQSEPPKKYSKKTNIKIQGARYHKALVVRHGNLRRAVIDVVITSQISSYGDWSISYLPKSGMFSIRTLMANRLRLVLSAVSSDPADGVTLKPFNPRDPLQQWIITK